MKGTLRKVNEGIVFTIDERPKVGDWFYINNSNEALQRFSLNDEIYINAKKIISSNCNIGFQLQFKIQQPNTYATAIGWDRYVQEKFNTEYPYTIQDNKVIIEL